MPQRQLQVIAGMLAVPRVVPCSEGTSARIPPATDVPSSSSGSQVITGMLAAPQDLMIRC